MENLGEKDQRLIWHPYTQMQSANNAIPIISAEGLYLYAENGEKYMDAISSWWTNLHGHAHPYMTQKLSEQLSKLDHIIFAGFTHSPAVELAEKLLDVLPGGHSRIFYSDNGSTAVEVAIKMSIQYWLNLERPRRKIIAFENAYHGDTFGSMSLSARGLFTDAYTDYLFDVVHIPAPEPGKESRAIESLNKLLENAEDYAAFIYEPLLQAASGMLIHSASTLDEMISMCRKTGIICIADEVMTGFGRTGKLFAGYHLQNKADINCLSKGLTGGLMPMGVTSCTENIYNAFLSSDKRKTFYHGHSFTGNPLSCCAALASLELLLGEECQQSIQRIAERHNAFAELLKTKYPQQSLGVGALGTVLRLDLGTSDHSYTSSLRDQLYDFFMEKGILMRPLGTVIYVLPPYCINESELDYIYQNILDCIEEFRPEAK